MSPRLKPKADTLWVAIGGMERRRFCGLVVGLLGGTAGCTDSVEPSGPRTAPQSPTPTASPTPTPRPGIEIAGRDIKPGPEGNFVFVLNLVNTADAPRQATYVVTVRADAVDFAAEKRKTVELAANVERTVEYTFDVSFDDWAKDGAVDFQRASSADE